MLPGTQVLFWSTISYSECHCVQGESACDAFLDMLRTTGKKGTEHMNFIADFSRSEHSMSGRKIHCQYCRLHFPPFLFCTLVYTRICILVTTSPHLSLYPSFYSPYQDAYDIEKVRQWAKGGCQALNL